MQQPDLDIVQSLNHYHCGVAIRSGTELHLELGDDEIQQLAYQLRLVGFDGGSNVLLVKYDGFLDCEVRKLDAIQFEHRMLLAILLQIFVKFPYLILVGLVDSQKCEFDVDGELAVAQLLLQDT